MDTPSAPWGLILSLVVMLVAVVGYGARLESKLTNLYSALRVDLLQIQGEQSRRLLVMEIRIEDLTRQHCGERDCPARSPTPRALPQ